MRACIGSCVPSGSPRSAARPNERLRQEFAFASYGPSVSGSKCSGSSLHSHPGCSSAPHTGCPPSVAQPALHPYRRTGGLVDDRSDPAFADGRPASDEGITDSAREQGGALSLCGRARGVRAPSSRRARCRGRKQRRGYLGQLPVKRARAAEQTIVSRGVRSEPERWPTLWHAKQRGGRRLETGESLHTSPRARVDTRACASPRIRSLGAAASRGRIQR